MNKKAITLSLILFALGFYSLFFSPHFVVFHTLGAVVVEGNNVTAGIGSFVLGALILIIGKISD